MKLFCIFLLCTSYTFIRYALFGDVPLEHWPAFLLNKALSFFAVVVLCLSAWYYRQNKFEDSKALGQVVWHSSIIHIGLSLALLNADYYHKFFGSSGLNLNGELLLVFGVLGSYCLWSIPRYRQQRLSQHRLKLLGVLLIAAHLLPMGQSWLTPEDWRGLPPISLLSFSVTVAALLIFGPMCGKP